MGSPTMVLNRFKTNGQPTAYAVNYAVPGFLGTDLFPFPLDRLSNGWLVAVAEITPTLAELMLVLNAEEQRHMKPGSVEKFSRDMANGEWKLTHQGIAFNQSGHLFDGQNRLRSVVGSGTAIESLVFFGAGGREEMSVLDTGATRTAHDAATVMGLQSHKSDIALIRAMVVDKPGTFKYTNTELISLLGKYRDSLAWLFENFKSGQGLFINPIRAAVGRAYYHCDLSRLQRFLSVYKLDVPATEAGDKNAVLLNKFVMSTDSTSRVTSSQFEMRAKALRCIIAFMNGEVMTKLQYGAAFENAYPLPENGKRIG